MVRLFALVALVAAGAAAAGVVPPSDLARIRALIGPEGVEEVYLPAKLPRTFRFISWRLDQTAAHVYGQDITLSWAHRGPALDWTVGGRSRCPAWQRVFPEDQRARIRGRVVYYSQGNHGSNVWTCLAHPDGRVRLIWAWVRNPFPGGRAAAMALLARAVRLG